MTSTPPRQTTILEAARDVLLRFPTANMTEIAERSGVHRSTLHRHFPTREALIEQLASAAVAAFDARVAQVEAQPGNAREAVRKATEALLRESTTWRVSRYVPLGTLPPGAARDRLRTRMLGLLEAGQRDGTVRADVAAPSLYFAWLGLILTWGAFREQVGESGSDDPAAAAGEVIRLLLPDPQPLELKIVPRNRTATSPARLVLEAEGEMSMRLVLDDWKPGEP
jgi:AcrR family transcriptional regulator